MAHDVIMPALGMAQDSGLLIAWRKAPGDAVAAGEPLFEVETDKATMEVEAAAAGFLSSITASAGEDVPVGQVIARIVETEAEVDRSRPAGKAAHAAPQPAPVVAPQSTPVAAPQPVPVAAAQAAPITAPPIAATSPQAPAPAKQKPALLHPAPAGRILASPKARTLAAEEGLDLARLVRAGHPQPYHVADLDRLRRRSAAARSSLSARVDGSALHALLKKAGGADSARVLAAFARGAWAQVTGEDLSVALQRTDGSREAKGALLLVDLSGTRLASYAPAAGFVLAVGWEPTSLVLTLTFEEEDLPFETAAAFLNETAARVEDPLRQLI